MDRATLELIVLAIGSTVLAAPVAAQDVEYSDVYMTVTELADEVELIREIMGRPFDDSARLPVAGISATELYFQGEILLVGANRLASELAGTELVYPPPVPVGAITPADTLRLVDAALVDVRRVRDALAITEPVVREDRDTPITPTGVFSVVLDVNRQLNLLLDDELASRDVHQRLTVAVTHAAGILASRGRRSPLPADTLEPKLPADVYRELLEALDLATATARRAGIDVLTLSSRRNVSDDIRPGDVYHVAQFLVADLTALALAVGSEAVAIELGPFPRHVFPAHTYRLAVLLRRQLEAIDALF
jgi:hypothetical protein